ncbi:MAG: alpha-ketoacid dehydrogenase subunit beta [Acetobacteraceae bacterium]|nr:alpha-ketoacid dehydrogenase subunit beta [Acetobacteraceae bacterium]
MRATLLEAVRLAALQEMRRDPRVWVLGEDVARGGLFGQYRGFLDEFGAARIVSTPISEATIMGAGLGAALVGTRPIVEMRIADFALCAMDELVNQAAKARYMFGGQARVPMVIRMPHGIWRNSAAQHSQMLEAWLAHIPGLTVACPATPADAAGLLVTAIRSDDPVVLLEPKNLWQSEGEIPDGGIPPLPFGEAAHLRGGRDLTLVSWSAMVPEALRAAEALAAEGIEAELLDLRTLWPWDATAVSESVARTGHLLVAHEAVETAGFGAEVVATVAERGVPHRAARVGFPRVPVPFAPPLEQALKPGAERLTAAARRLLGR